MFRIRKRELVEGRVEIGPRSFEVVRSESMLRLGWGHFDFSAEYVRPAALRVVPGRSSVPIRDYVMWARLTAVTIVIASLIRRWTSD